MTATTNKKNHLTLYIILGLALGLVVGYAAHRWYLPHSAGIAALQLQDPRLFRQQCYIDGCWRDADDGRTIAVNNPATGEILGSVPAMGAGETRAAIAAAHRAWPAWRGPGAGGGRSGWPVPARADALGDVVVGPRPVVEPGGAGLQVAAPPLAEPDLGAADGSADGLDGSAGEAQGNGAVTSGKFVVHGYLRVAAVAVARGGSSTPGGGRGRHQRDPRERAAGDTNPSHALSVRK